MAWWLLIAVYSRLCAGSENWEKPLRELMPVASPVAPYRSDVPLDDRLLHVPLMTSAKNYGDALAVASGES